MDQSSADKILNDILIIQLMPIAESVGKSYAYKHKKHQDECIAEAYYQLTLLVINKWQLLFEAYNMGGYVRISLFKKLGRYFRFEREKSLIIFSNDEGKDNKDLTPRTLDIEIEMIDWLEIHFPEAYQIYKYLRQGFDLDDIEYLKPRFKNLCKFVDKKKRERTKRLNKLRECGITPILNEKLYNQNRPNQWLLLLSPLRQRQNVQGSV